MTTVFPSVIFQQQVNSVSTRQIQPNGHGSFDFVWTHFGFADDTEEMTARRLRGGHALSGSRPPGGERYARGRCLSSERPTPVMEASE
jgi:hypothetical protein